MSDIKTKPATSAVSIPPASVFRKSTKRERRAVMFELDADQYAEIEAEAAKLGYNGDYGVTVNQYCRLAVLAYHGIMPSV